VVVLCVVTSFSSGDGDSMFLQTIGTHVHCATNIKCLKCPKSETGSNVSIQLAS
jgi:hypothetical protein